MCWATSMTNKQYCWIQYLVAFWNFTFHFYEDMLINKHPQLLFYRFSSQILHTFSLFHIKVTVIITKAFIKIAARAIYTYLSFFSDTDTICNKIKSFYDRCFPQQITLQTTVQLYILRDFSSLRIGNMNSKRHTLPIICTVLV